MKFGASRKRNWKRLSLSGHAPCYCRFPPVGPYFRLCRRWTRSCGKSKSSPRPRCRTIMFSPRKIDELEVDGFAPFVLEETIRRHARVFEAIVGRSHEGVALVTPEMN